MNTKDLAQDMLNSLHDYSSQHFRGGSDTSKRHLVWMLGEIMKNYEDWPEHKLHRWLGYVQGVLVNNQLTTVEDQRILVRKYI